MIEGRLNAMAFNYYSSRSRAWQGVVWGGRECIFGLRV